MAEHGAGDNRGRYYVPAPTAWPFILTVGLALTIFGVGHWLESETPIPVAYPIGCGVALVLFIAFRWFRRVAQESEAGSFNDLVDHTFRLGMGWFIFSEVMFFGGFFGALFYTHVLSVPWLGGHGYRYFTGAVLWPHFAGTWPSNGPAHIGGRFQPMDAWGLPAINTAVLISSSFTITYAHHKLKENKRRLCILWMLLTIALGSIFLGLQAHEYLHAYFHQHLSLHSGVYGSTFFMMTGFHGLHVTLGVIMLAVITIRLALGHFKPDRHFGFEGVAWYWHFVDVVWIMLFTFVYVLA